MALTNSQYDQMMRTYEQRQLDNEYQLRKRFEKAYSLIPELRITDQSIAPYLERRIERPDSKEETIT